MENVIEGVQEALRRVDQVARSGGERLSLAGLGLESVPPEVRALRALTELDLSGNRLVEIPEWLGELTGLRRLDLGDNRMVDVPVWVGGLPLEHLELAGNPHLLVPPPDVVEAGALAALEYLRAATSAESASRSRPAMAFTRRPIAMPSITLRPSRRVAAIGGAAVLLGVAALAIAVNSGGPGTPVHPAGNASGIPSSAAPTPSLTAHALGALANSSALAPSGPSLVTPKKPFATTPGAIGGTHTAVALVKPPVLPPPPVSPYIAPPPVPAHTTAAAPPPPPPPPPPPAPPQPPQQVSGQIVGYGGLCLDDQGASTADYNPVQIFNCNGTAAQNWTLVRSDDSIRVFGKCLDVYAALQSNGTAVDLYACNGTGAQVWIPRSDGSLFNPNSGKCLDDTDWSTTPGRQVQIWDCNSGQGNQTWQTP